MSIMKYLDHSFMKLISINFNLLIISVILKLTNVVCCFLTVKRTVTAVYNIHQHIYILSAADWVRRAFWLSLLVYDNAISSVMYQFISVKYILFLIYEILQHSIH